MARVGILHPETLLGTELRERLGETPLDVTLLTASSEPGSAVLSEFAGAPSLVHEATEEALSSVELAFVCTDGPGSFKDLPFQTGTTVLHLGGAREGQPVVAGVNVDPALRGERIYSPPAGLVAAAYVTQALKPFDPLAGSAMFVNPVSTYGQPGITELAAQAQATLGLSEQPTDVLGQQLAFLMTAGPQEPSTLEGIMAQVLPGLAPFPVFGLQAGVFHGVSCLVQLRFPEEIAHSELIDSIEMSRYLEWRDEPTLNQLEVAGSDRVVVARVESAGFDSAWIWTLTDNLTRGAALNAIDVARELHPDLLPPALAAV